MDALNEWAHGLVVSWYGLLVASKDQLAAIAGPAIAEPAWAATFAICKANLVVFKWVLVNISGSSSLMTKGLLYEYKPVDPSSLDGIKAGGYPSEWRRQKLCPEVLGKGPGMSTDAKCIVRQTSSLTRRAAQPATYPLRGSISR